MAGRRSLVKSNATRSPSRATREWRTQIVHAVQETLLKSEKIMYSASWERVSTIIWVDNCLEDSVRYRRPPQIAKYTVNIPQPRGTSHQRKYLGSPTPVRPVASSPQIRIRRVQKGRRIGTRDQSVSVLTTKDGNRQRGNATQRYSNLRNENKKKFKAGSHRDGDKLNKRRGEKHEIKMRPPPAHEEWNRGIMAR